MGMPSLVYQARKIQISSIPTISPMKSSMFKAPQLMRNQREVRPRSRREQISMKQLRWQVEIRLLQSPDKTQGPDSHIPHS